MQDFLSQLNKEQQEAVRQTEGPTIVLAGAGSGKTRVLVHKVLYLIIEKKVNPLNILMVTFTNKAAGEMKERIEKALSSFGLYNGGNLPTVGTFHSLCARILRRDGFNIGISNRFRIYDTDDQVETVKDALEILDIPIKNVKPRSILNSISNAKNQLITPDVYTSFARGYFQETVSHVYPLYENLLRERDAVDFDDLMIMTIKLFRENPSVLEKYQERFHYIMVDEYQDTNPVQYLLTKLLGGKYNNICIVGDFSQSIYSFRGADFKNLQKFKKDNPTALTFPLSQNYRSSQKILDAATSVISNNTTHPVLSLWTENNGGEDIEIFQAETEHQEIEYIIGKVKERQRSDASFTYRDVAVLYRTNAQSRTVEEVFLHHGIPYVLIGGVRFYDRREIKDVLAMLSYLSNQKDAVSLKRIGKIGERKQQTYLEYVNDVLLKNMLDDTNTIDILDQVVSKISYLEMYDQDDPEDRMRLENIKELRSVAIEFPDIHQFLENVALVEQEYSPAGRAGMPDSVTREEKPNAVTLMTLHAAKGLEFKIIFLVGMEEGLFPHSQSLLDTNEIEEERRLCYVGITRAKEKLVLSYSKRRLIYGQRMTPTLSRFILELPKEVLEKNSIDTYADEPDYF